MAWVAVISGGATLLGGMMSSGAQASSGEAAASAQLQGTQLGIDESRRQFDIGLSEQRAQLAKLQGMLAPFVSAGNAGLSGQQDLLGLNGPTAQQGAIRSVENSPMFDAMSRQGEDAILSAASATGGLRGGNTQAALAQFRPQLLAQLIEQKYGRLGGLTTLGQNSALGVGNAGMQTGANIAQLAGQQGNLAAQLMQQGGAAQAGGILAAGRGQAGMINSVVGGIGQFAGMGGFGGVSSPNFGGYTPPTSGPGGSFAESPFQLNGLF